MPRRRLVKHITIEPGLLDLALEKARSRLYGNFSAYVEHLIRVDTLSMKDEEKIKKDSGRNEE